MSSVTNGIFPSSAAAVYFEPCGGVTALGIALVYVHVCASLCVCTLGNRRRAVASILALTQEAQLQMSGRQRPS